MSASDELRDYVSRNAKCGESPLSFLNRATGLNIGEAEFFGVFHEMHCLAFLTKLRGVIRYLVIGSKQ